MIKKTITWFAIFTFLLVSMVLPPSYTNAATDIRLMVDGVDITSLSAPYIVNDRTLVPVRFIAEQLGADVSWDGEAYTVTITRGNDVVFLTIGSRLVEYDNGASCIVSDVAPRIINDRTYVPIRLISNAFGIGISWDNDTRTVLIDSSKDSEVEAFYDVDISSVSHGLTLTGATQIDFTASEQLRDSASEIRLMILAQGTTQGLIVDRGSSDTSSFPYSPSPSDNGEKTLAVLFYDDNNNFIAGDAVSVNINIVPDIQFTGIERMDYVSDSASFGIEANFPIYAVEYKINNQTSGKTRNISKIDPLAEYTWTPTWEENGICYIEATVYDNRGNGYNSESIPVVSRVSRSISLAGVYEGMTIDSPVSLIASRNFDVNETTYMIRDPKAGTISVIASVPYGSYEWFPGPELSGEKELMVMVRDTSGIARRSDFVHVTISDSPEFIFKGLGPGQVLTSNATLSVKSNITPDSVRYRLTDLDSGIARYLDATDSLGSAAYVPTESDNGSMRIQAEVSYNGQTYTTSSVDFTVYTGETYGPMPVVGKDEFLDFASEMAVESMESTGMSAALQTAQAILETGWGQSVPVDKYTGQFSHNLFGVKGTGTEGSVISNTWEVYNGVSFRTDAYFRAFANVDEAWADHKEFLLNLSRYEEFRQVMYDYAKGAWALKRAGYATDPQYAIKLMNLVNRYNLWTLDLKGF